MKEVWCPEYRDVLIRELSLYQDILFISVVISEGHIGTWFHIVL